MHGAILPTSAATGLLLEVVRPPPALFATVRRNPTRLAELAHRRQTRGSMTVGEHDPFDLEEQAQREELVSSTARSAAELEAKDFVWLMEGPRGRRIVYRLLSRCGVFRTSFSPNAMEMARQEGLKQLGYWILSEIERLCPAFYTTMLEEKRQ